MLKYPQGGGPGRERVRGKIQERIQLFVDMKINWYLGHLDLDHGMWREVEYGELVVPRRSSGDSRGRWQGPGLAVGVWEGFGQVGEPGLLEVPGEKTAHRFCL